MNEVIKMATTHFARKTAKLAVPFALVFAAVAALTAFSRAQNGSSSASPQTLVAAVSQQQFDAQGKAVDGTAREPLALAPSAQQFNAQGEQVQGGAAAAATATAHACLEFYNSPTNTWKIDVTFNPLSYPYVITGGTIKGTICGSPNWVVTGGSMGGSLLVNANRTGAPAPCANTVTIVGTFRNPSSYAGTYGFDGQSTSFTHTSLYCCGTCPP
jgi:hypothetical protein